MLMNKLSKQQFEQAKNFLKSKARKLERALFEFEFENGSKENVLKQLKQYQNENGGFGNGLEPDFRCKESSALATAIGLHILSRVGVDETNELVKKAVNYLLNTFNKEKMGWQIVPKEVETTPRAIWWNYSEDWEWGNPSTEIIGLLHHYKGLVPAEFLDDVTKFAIDYVHNLHKYEHHELLSFLKLSEKLSDKEYNFISNKLRVMVKACVTDDPEKWDFYCLQPIQVVKSSSSEYYDLFADIIPINLDFIVRKQSQDGYWEPTWSWGQFEEEWETAKEEWRGWLTLEYLRILRSFGRIEN
jgi:hypothetical protein